ncbi:MAG: hypothetical protein ACOY46_00405 [Bacillota bacterium]
MAEEVKELGELVDMLTKSWKDDKKKWDHKDDKKDDKKKDKKDDDLKCHCKCVNQNGSNNKNNVNVSTGDA